MRGWVLLATLAVLFAGSASADNQTSRAALRISTHLSGQATSLDVCARTDTANAAAYRSAAADYRRDPAISAADAKVQRIMAEDAQKSGLNPREAQSVPQQMTVAVMESLRRAAAADPAKFATECQSELRNFQARAGSFAPLDKLFPYEMRVINAWYPGR